MAPTLLFVHGTGVRGRAFTTSLKTITHEVASRGLGLEVRGCFPPGQLPPAAALREQLLQFTPSRRLEARLAALELSEEFVAALTALRAAPEFAEAVATAPVDPLEHRQVIARALVAHAVAAAAAGSGQPDRD